MNVRFESGTITRQIVDASNQIALSFDYILNTRSII